VFVMWLDFVTYLHHHGHEQQLPWYRGKGGYQLARCLHPSQHQQMTSSIGKRPGGLVLS
ncbi:fatty acid desaturase (DSD1), partial [Sarracenia purpurea var. burkii]